MDEALDEFDRVVKENPDLRGRLLLPRAGLPRQGQERRGQGGPPEAPAARSGQQVRQGRQGVPQGPRSRLTALHAGLGSPPWRSLPCAPCRPACLAGGLIAGCGDGPSSAPTHPGGRRRPHHHRHPAGRRRRASPATRRVETPVLDRLAAAGRVFDDAHAHNVVTLPSHTNILTGLYPYQHGVRDNSGFAPAAEGADARHPAQAARATRPAPSSAAYPLDASSASTSGFDVYDDRFPRGSNPAEFVIAERRGDQVVAAALAWWDGAEGQAAASSGSTSTTRTPPTIRRSRSPAATGTTPTWARSPPPTPSSAPLLVPFLDGQGAAGPGGRHRRPRRGAGRARRADPRPVRLRGDAQGAAGRLGRRASRRAATRRPARHVDIVPTVLSFLATRRARRGCPAARCSLPPPPRETRRLLLRVALAPA